MDRFIKNQTLIQTWITPLNRHHLLSLTPQIRKQNHGIKKIRKQKTTFLKYQNHGNRSTHNGYSGIREEKRNQEEARIGNRVISFILEIFFS